MKPAPAGVPYYQDLHVLGSLSAASALLVAWTFPYWGASLEFLCPLRELTGIPCPTCFGTRAMLALAAGDWAAALRFNPLVASGGMALLVYIPWGPATAWWGRGRLAAPGPAATVFLAWCGVALVVANWAYLIVAHT